MTFPRKGYNSTLAALVVINLTLGGILVTRFLNTTIHTPKDVPVIPKKAHVEVKAEEIASPNSLTVNTPTPTPKNTLSTYIEVTSGCGTHYEEECLLVRSGPGTDFPVVYRLRNGIVLKVSDKVEHEGILWYKIIFDEWLRYPERLAGDWYVAAEFVTPLHDEGELTVGENEYITSSLKKIIVDRKEQKLYAYEDDTIFMETSISTGLELTPTPRGTFTIFKKTPSRYMQGPLPGLADQQSYDLPGVPWNLYFTHGGAVIHGAYWHNSFGSQYSHGCVNLLPADARKLYHWADLGTQVIVKN